MTHPFITGLVAGWMSLMLAQALALWWLERWINKEEGKANFRKR